MSCKADFLIVFEKFLKGLKPGSVVVFDNVEEVERSPLQTSSTYTRTLDIFLNVYDLGLFYYFIDHYFSSDINNDNYNKTTNNNCTNNNTPSQYHYISVRVVLQLFGSFAD